MNTATWIKAGSTCGLFAAAGLLGVGSSQGRSAQPPETIYLTGIVRDFKEHDAPGGHPDFDLQPTAGFGVYCKNVGETLGENGKPAFTGAGKKVSSHWKDNQNRRICYCVYNAALGDTAGSFGVSNTAATQSAATFNQWFNDVPGVNMSTPLTVALHRQPDGSYVFDDKQDPAYTALGGFFPIEGQLLGNPGGTPNRNFHFTFELHTEFTYDADGGQTFKFVGDDDVFVFINGKKVIDLGGVHGAAEQYVDLNRLNLTDGETYPLDFFFAERHRTQSNCRIVTNLHLESAPIPSVSAAFD